MHSNTPAPSRVGSLVWFPKSAKATWSPRLCELLGLDPALTEPSLAPLYAAVHEEDLEPLRKIVAAPEEDADIQVRVAANDGDERILHITATVLDEGERVVLTLFDITAAVTSVQRARQDERLLLQAQESAGLGTFRYFPELDRGEWSPQTYRILGYGEEVIPNAERFFARIHPADLQAFMGAMQQAERGNVNPVEGRVVRPDGTMVHVMVAGSVLQIEGRPDVWQGTLIDLTERKQLEQQLSHAQKMEAIGTLAGGLAHDFNNYLSVVVNNLSLLRDHVESEDDVVDALHDIELASERCRILTQRLLAFGRKQPHRPRDVDVCWLVKSLRGMLDRLVGDHIDVVTRTPKAPLCAHLDPGQLEQVVVNLVINARDAMERGGTVTISVDRAVVDEEHAERHSVLEPGPHLKIAVADTGSGIPESVRSRIFDPFFTTKQEGTGLGLSTVHGIVEQNKGAVTLTSSPETGTSFVVCIPQCFPEALPVSPHDRADEVEGGSETVLLVEDQPEVMRAVRRTLGRYGYRVMAFANAEEGLAAWRREGDVIDMLLSDVQLPGMSGAELAEALRADRPTLPVVLMTGYAPEEVLAAVNAPNLHVLQKPVGVDELLLTLRIALAPEG